MDFVNWDALCPLSSVNFISLVQSAVDICIEDDNSERFRERFVG